MGGWAWTVIGGVEIWFRGGVAPQLYYLGVLTSLRSLTHKKFNKIIHATISNGLSRPTATAAAAQWRNYIQIERKQKARAGSYSSRVLLCSLLWRAKHFLHNFFALSFLTPRSV